MRLYRVMSSRELRDILENREEALKRDWRGRRVRYKWFATDLGYIATIMARKTYRNFQVASSYEVIAELEIDGTFIVKKELGFVNLGLDTEKPYTLVRINWVRDAREWFETKGRNMLRALAYYWNRRGEMKVIAGTREFDNILRNGNFRKRPFFVRADKYLLFNTLCSAKCVVSGD